MPLYLEPNKQFPVVLDSDADKPEEARPTFFAISQSMRGQQEIGEALDAWVDSPDLSLKELFDRTIDALSGAVAGWKNMGGTEFSVDAMRTVLNYNEARELLRKVLYNQHVTTEEKKSSELPQQSEQA